MRLQRKRYLNALLLVMRVMGVNRKRCFLAVVGIAVGIAAVTTLASFGYVAQQELAHELARLGTNIVIVESSRSPQGGSRATLTEHDVTELREEVDGIAAMAPVILQQGEISDDTGAVRTDIIATDTTFIHIREMELSQGTLFSDVDDSEAEKVVLLGQTVTTLLFDDDAEPVGNTVKINNSDFTVIGVLAELGLDANGNDQDDMVIIPLATAPRHASTGAQKYLTHIYIEVAQAEMVPKVKEAIVPVLRSSHQLETYQPDPFNIYDQAQLLAARSDILGSVEDLIYALAAITLLAGGLGITAVQLISIRERTWEIGLHRALGARRRDIIVQFILESTILGGLGGTLGVVIGLMAPLAVASIFALSPVIAWPVLGISLITGVTIGVAAGIYPAIYASRLDPVIALRSG